MLNPVQLGLVAILALSGTSSAYTASSTSEESVTAPVDFTWPEARPWYVAYQNEAPCGTNASVGARTEFPLDSGIVSIVAAGNAYSVAFSIAYVDNVTSQSDFTTQLAKTASVSAGHQCYTLPDSAATITAGTNATIQLEYTAQYNGSAYEIFYSCADITFVNPSDFTTDVACFNATVTGPSSNPIESSAATSSTASTTAGSKSRSGLSVGSEAGIAVGSIVGGLAVLGCLAFFFLRRRAAAQVQRDDERAIASDLKPKASMTSFSTANTTTN
ncbi:hypothetical protein BP6252_02830 [Coleophoma cylindrospora]|uniref:Copper acquisition factor BIM1-like domain-containing protein n=1 Tax=Coleophoma cylindrospora TaxID=1849047 RepID=A0A3D8SFX4_9HELO|nr:hypothetical protein BP6252_02830 [Coleophoma cylindrospora]